MLEQCKKSTFYVHDYETFGKNPALDRPVQFAGVRTDDDFNIIDDPLVIYCAPANDYLPQPEAVLITGITPRYALKHGVNEAEFCQKIHQQFSVAGTCTLGYNNIRFDDEVSRNIFYRNFYDPYAYNWQNGNSRWDLLDVVRACYALRPQGINWPKNANGLPSFQLEHLAKANGIQHLKAHDAMSDVYATIELAKLVKQAQPLLFKYFYHHRSKHKIKALINIENMTPLVHVSGMFGVRRSNISLVAPLAWHPENKNAVIVCDLAADISPLSLDVNTLREHLYTPKDSLNRQQITIPLKLVHINKCPILAPVNTWREKETKRLKIDLQYCLNQLESLRQNPQITEKVNALFKQMTARPKVNNVDTQLYCGFFNDTDHNTIKKIQQTSPQNLPALNFCFQDPRLETLLFRFRARNYHNTLDDTEQRRWLEYRKEVLSPEKIKEYILQLNQLCYQYQNNEEKSSLLKSLLDYVCRLAG